MTKMIPSTIVKTKTPSGERNLYKKLQMAKGTEGWIALHSFDLVRHETKAESEIDMILIIPDAGVLFIEVKDVGMSRKGGTWHYADNRRPDAGPFVQAREAMHSIREDLSKLNPEFAKLLYFSAVVTPSIDFRLTTQTFEWHDWQVLDKVKFNSVDFPLSFRSLLEKAHQHISSVGKKWYDRTLSRPNQMLAEKLAEALRPNFVFSPDMRTAIQHISSEIRAYTDEQLDALNALEGNPRILVTGPAGTGKTVIAVEAFKRSVAEGKRVALICFNRLLGKKLEAELQPFIEKFSASDRAVVTTFHNFLLEVSGIAKPENPRNDFWKNELPEAALTALLSGDSLLETDFDEVIVDEAQDLMLPQYIDCMEAILSSSLEKSEWLMLGDFKNQAIYEGDLSNLLSRLNGQFTQTRLTKNCRNAGQIVGQIKLVFGVEPAYRETLPELEGAEAKVEFYHSPSEQLDHVEKSLDRYLENFLPNEVAILSPISDGICESVLSRRMPNKLARAASSRPEDKNKIRFSTIHAFKGLEAPVILITDITDLDEDDLALLYVAISRAKACVTIFLNQRLKKRWMELLTEGLKR
ncbi:AAA family ATPase [Litorivicinus sp.]|nr:AAA family ATPase [Litorivicinus sp.]